MTNRVSAGWQVSIVPVSLLSHIFKIIHTIWPFSWIHSQDAHHELIPQNEGLRGGCETGTLVCLASDDFFGDLKINISHCDKALNFTVGWYLPSDKSSLGGVKPIKMQKSGWKDTSQCSCETLKSSFHSEPTNNGIFPRGHTGTAVHCSSVAVDWLFWRQHIHRQQLSLDAGQLRDNPLLSPSWRRERGFKGLVGKWSAEPAVILLKDAQTDTPTVQY